jgi:Protein of unknown function (DUF4003)
MNQKLNLYIETVELLKENFRWRMSTQIISLIASIYVMNNKTLEPEQLKILSTTITKQVGWFSPFRSYQKYNVAASLISKYNDSETKFSELHELFKELRTQGFPNNAFTIISALALLDDDMDVLTRAAQIKKIYKKMKEQHIFLTSHSDYPLATLLALENKELDILMNGIETYYQGLIQVGFKAGNDLQFLSHILMIIDDQNMDDRIEKVKNLKEKCQDEGIKVRRPFYTVLGLLSSIDLKQQDVVELKDLIEHLNHNKHLKYNYQINPSIGAMLLLMRKIDDPQLIQTNLSTTIETIIQAQQAAMVAVMASTSAAAASASN